MNSRINRRRRDGFSLLEVIVVIVTVLLVLAVLPYFFGRRAKPYSQFKCINNLKQVALASRMWSNDHVDRFPWEVSTNHGGSLEWAASPEVFRHFMVMSNEVATPKILLCPSDRERLRAGGFLPTLANSNVSYFIGLEADATQPLSILSGDRNVTGGVTNGALLSFRSDDVPQWASSIHTNQGNLALVDGSVQRLTDQALARQFQSARAATGATTTLRLAIPRTPQDAVAGKRTESPLKWLVPWTAGGAGLAALVGGWLIVRRRLLAWANGAAPQSVSHATRP